MPVNKEKLKKVEKLVNRMIRGYTEPNGCFLESIVIANKLFPSEDSVK